MPIAHDEAHLPAVHLTSELTRTTVHLRLPADEIETGRPGKVRGQRQTRTQEIC